MREEAVEDREYGGKGIGHKSAATRSARRRKRMRMEVGAREGRREGEESGDGDDGRAAGDAPPAWE